MAESVFEGVGPDRQLAALEARALDDRPSLATPFPSMNELLHRGGCHPGELVLVGGRKGTRKTCVTLAWIAHLLRQGVPVGFVTLDESLAMYTAKLMSTMYRIPSEYIEEEWRSEQIGRLRAQYAQDAANLTMSVGVRPNIEALQRWLDYADVDRERPRVVFCDYANLLGSFRGRSSERIPQLFEDLQVFTRENELVAVVLHQAGRTDEGVSKKYHGDTPMTAEGLLYGGEQYADIIFATYRPEMNYLGNLSRPIAEIVLGDTFDEEKWANAVQRVRHFGGSTMLQLLKNRPSTKGEWFEGLELNSPDDSQYIEEKFVDQDMTGPTDWVEG